MRFSIQYKTAVLMQCIVLAACGPAGNSHQNTTGKLFVPVPDRQLAVSSVGADYVFSIIVNGDEQNPIVPKNVVYDAINNTLVSDNSLRLRPGHYTLEVVVSVANIAKFNMELYRTGLSTVDVGKKEHKRVTFDTAGYQYADSDDDFHSNYYEFVLGTDMLDRTQFPSPQQVTATAEIENIVLEWQSTDPWAGGRDKLSYSVLIATANSLAAKASVLSKDTADAVIEHAQSPFRSIIPLSSDDTYHLAVVTVIPELDDAGKPGSETALSRISSEMVLAPLAPEKRIGVLDQDYFGDPNIVFGM